jgi:hypothetical protein
MIDVVRKNLKIEVPALTAVISVLPVWQPCLGCVFMAVVQHQDGPRRLGFIRSTSQLPIDHDSVRGTNRTSSDVCSSVAIGGKADVALSLTDF